jgi:hypothetical protein
MELYPWENQLEMEDPLQRLMTGWYKPNHNAKIPNF